MSLEDVVPFSALCGLLQRLDQAGRAPARRRLLGGFLAQCQARGDTYPVVRLLLPAADRARSQYGLRETSLARAYVAVLGLAGAAPDAQRLLSWRRPDPRKATSDSASSSNNSTAGDFGAVLEQVLARRCPVRGTLSVADANTALDRLQGAADRAGRVAVLRDVLRRTTAAEHKWFVRAVLQDLRVGVGVRTVLSLLHPRAFELYCLTSDLRRVCAEVAKLRRGETSLLTVPSSASTSATNSTTKNNSNNTLTDVAVTLFQPVVPMLASRRRLEALGALLAAHRYVLQTKFDGERLQVHKDGDRVRLFARSGRECTALYGDHVARVVRRAITARQCILDGELVVWDRARGRAEEFGRLRAFAADAGRGAAPDAHRQLCLAVFDVLLVDGRPLLACPLAERCAVLARIVAPVPHALEVVAHRAAPTVDALARALDAAVLAREEGVMLKDLDSPYAPGARTDAWLKLKPDYVDGIGDDLDLVVVGGYYGEGRRGGTLSHFLLGVPSESEAATSGASSATTTEATTPVFMSIAKVGSGYSDAQLASLQMLLAPRWRACAPGACPPCLVLAAGGERPDVWIDPAESCVLQVKAAQIVPSTRYRAGVTLRFPRVVRLRPDRSWRTCTTLAEVLRLRDEFQGHAATTAVAAVASAATPTADSDADLSGGKARKRARAGTGPVVSSLFRGADVRNVAVVSNAFAGLELCVLNGDAAHSKAALETLIAQHGGHTVQTPRAETHAVVAARESVRVRNIVRAGTCDVVTVQWVLDCARTQTRVPLTPAHLLFATEPTAARLRTRFDAFGDSYTEDATPASLAAAFARTGPTLPPLDPTEVATVEQQHLGPVWWGMFRGLRIFLNGAQRSSLASVVAFFAGTVDEVITPATTHIVVDDEEGDHGHGIARDAAQTAVVVTAAWLRDSVRAGFKQDEGRYRVC